MIGAQLDLHGGAPGEGLRVELASHAVGSLEHVDAEVVLAQSIRAVGAGHPGPDHHNV